jgi:hypothetical protein
LAPREAGCSLLSTGSGSNLLPRFCPGGRESYL